MIMFFPIFSFGSKERRSRSSPPEVVPLSCQSNLRPLSCRPLPTSRHSIAVLDDEDTIYPGRSALPRRTSFVEHHAISPIQEDDHVVEMVCIQPSRCRTAARTERWVESRTSRLEVPDEHRQPSQRRALMPKQGLVIEYPSRSRRQSRSTSRSPTRSASSSQGHRSARSASTISRRSESTARSTITASSAKTHDSVSTVDSASSASSAASSPDMAKDRQRRPSSVSASSRRYGS